MAIETGPSIRCIYRFFLSRLAPSSSILYIYLITVTARFHLQFQKPHILVPRTSSASDVLWIELESLNVINSFYETVPSLSIASLLPS
jgi:hypothetical protein